MILCRGDGCLDTTLGRFPRQPIVAVAALRRRSHIVHRTERIARIQILCFVVPSVHVTVILRLRRRGRAEVSLLPPVRQPVLISIDKLIRPDGRLVQSRISPSTSARTSPADLAASMQGEVARRWTSYVSCGSALKLHQLAPLSQPPSMQLPTIVAVSVCGELSQAIRPVFFQTIVFSMRMPIYG